MTTLRANSLIEAIHCTSNRIHPFTLKYENPKNEEYFQEYKYEKKNLLLAIGFCIFFNAFIQSLRKTQVFLFNFFQLSTYQEMPLPLGISILVTGNLAYILEILVFFINPLRILRGFAISIIPIGSGIVTSYINIKITCQSSSTPTVVLVMIFYLMTSILCSFIYASNWICGAIQVIIIIILMDIYIMYFDWSWASDKPFLLAISLSTLICLVLAIYYFEYIQRKCVLMKIIAETQTKNFNMIVDKLPEPIIFANNGNCHCYNEAFIKICQPESQISFRGAEEENNMNEIHSVPVINSNDFHPEIIISKLISENQQISLKEVISRNDHVEEEEFKLIEESETKKVFEISSFNLQFNDKDYFIYLLKDLNHYYKIKELKMKEQCQTVYFASIVHDFRTPLSIISGCTELLMDSCLNQYQQSHLIKIVNSSSFLSLLVQDILDFSQLKGGNFSIDVQNFNIENEFQSILDLMMDKYNDKGLYLKMEIGIEVPKYIMNDSNRLKQILMNLLSNAIKFTKKGGVKIKVSKKLDNYNFIEVKVQDTGIGIKQEDMKLLFKEYCKIGSHKSLNPKGIGLGLFICKKIIQKLGGDITVESKINVGTRFKFFFPSQSSPSPIQIQNISKNNSKESEEQIEMDQEFNKKIQIEEVKVNPRKSTFNCKFPEITKNTILQKSPSDTNIRQFVFNSQIQICKCSKILIVDDDVGIRNILKSFSERLIIPYDEASNGLIAIQKVKSKMESNCCKWYQFIFTDVSMPELDGVELSIQIHKELKRFPHNNTKIVLLSGITEEEKRLIQSNPLMPSHRIEKKPIKFHVFKDILSSILNSA